MSGRDRGQAAVLVLVVATVLFVSMSAALVEVGGRVIDRTRAQTAADAAALGSITGGREAAETLARRHGATLLSFTRGPDGGRVIVVVRLGTATADAAASDAP
jgi:Flp pilus assembly protein TadG